MNETNHLEGLAAAVENMDMASVKALVNNALADGLRPAEVLNKGLSEGMRRIGEKFKCGDAFMPEVLVSCDVYFAGLDVVRPLLKTGDEATICTMVLGNIHGDVHTVGKQVAMPVFEASGIRVIDVGESLDDQVFVKAIRMHKPQIVGLGTYMTSTFMHTAETVRAIQEAGLRSQVKIICGGPAVDAEAARRMGADDASDDAWDAVRKIKALLGVKP
jgi:5-methyltetrahydrofolate--homocysteine methyltransferase